MSDIVVRTAIIEGLAEIREKPYLLDFIFSALLDDELTLHEYGEKEAKEARDWFLNTDITVSMATRADMVKAPMIAISLEDFSEGSSTLGDTHYDPRESINVEEIVIQPDKAVGPFTPKEYDSETGIVTLPSSFTTDRIYAGMLLVDPKTKKTYAIQEVLDEESFTIETGVRASFTKAYVAPATSFYMASLESVEEREAYRIDLYVSGNATQLRYLYAIVKFALHRNKEKLLEARGFERSVLSGGGERIFGGSMEKPEVFFTRNFMLTGYVRQYWPKDLKPLVQGVSLEITAEPDDDDFDPFLIHSS
jgi:hypothetical protein